MKKCLAQFPQSEYKMTQNDANSIFRQYKKENSLDSLIGVVYKDISPNLQFIIDNSIENPDPTFLTPVYYYFENKTADLILIYNNFRELNFRSLRNLSCTYRNIIFSICNGLFLLGDSINFSISKIFLGQLNEPKILPIFVADENNSDSHSKIINHNKQKFMDLLKEIYHQMHKYDENSETELHQILDDFNQNSFNLISYDQLLIKMLNLSTFQNDSNFVHFYRKLHLIRKGFSKINISYFQQCLSSLDVIVDFLENKNDILNFGTLYMKDGEIQKDYRKALAVLGRIKPYTKESLYNMGICLLNLEENRLAEKCFQNSADLGSAKAAFNFACILNNSFQNIDQKIKYFHKSLELSNGTFLSAYSNLASLFVLRNEEKKAIDILKTGAKKFNDSNCFYNLFVLTQKNKYLNKAADLGNQKAINKLNLLEKESKLSSNSCQNKNLNLNENKESEFDFSEFYYWKAVKCLNENDKENGLLYLQKSYTCNNKSDKVSLMLYKLTKNVKYLHKSDKVAAMNYYLSKYLMDDGLLEIAAKMRHPKSLYKIGLIKESADAGYNKAQYEIGKHLLEESKNGDQKKKKEALHYLKLAAISQNMNRFIVDNPETNNDFKYFDNNKNFNNIPFYQYEYANIIKHESSSDNDMHDEYLKYLTKSAESNYGKAIYDLALLSKNNHNESTHNDVFLIEELKRSGSFGNIQAYFQLALHYMKNPETRNQAISLLLFCSNFNLPEAQLCIAHMYSEGLYLEKNQQQCITYLKKAAPFLLEAKYNLALLTKNLKLLLECSNLGYLDATFIIAKKYLKSHINRKEGIALMQKCYENNIKGSVYYMAKILRAKGDYYEAFQLFSQEARKGNHKAITQIAFMVESGQGTTKDKFYALELFEKSNNPHSKIALARYHINTDPSYSLKLLQNVKGSEADFLKKMAETKINSAIIKLREDKSIMPPNKSGMFYTNGKVPTIIADPNNEVINNPVLWTFTNNTQNSNSSNNTHNSGVLGINMPQNSNWSSSNEDANRSSTPFNIPSNQQNMTWGMPPVSTNPLDNSRNTQMRMNELNNINQQNNNENHQNNNENQQNNNENQQNNNENQQNNNENQQNHNQQDHINHQNNENQTDQNNQSSNTRRGGNNLTVTIHRPSNPTQIPNYSRSATNSPRRINIGLSPRSYQYVTEHSDNMPHVFNRIMHHPFSQSASTGNSENETSNENPPFQEPSAHQNIPQRRNSTESNYNNYDDNESQSNNGDISENENINENNNTSENTNTANNNSIRNNENTLESNNDSDSDSGECRPRKLFVNINMLRNSRSAPVSDSSWEESPRTESARVLDTYQRVLTPVGDSSITRRSFENIQTAFQSNRPSSIVPSTTARQPPEPRPPLTPQRPHLSTGGQAWYFTDSDDE